MGPARGGDLMAIGDIVQIALAMGIPFLGAIVVFVTRWPTDRETPLPRWMVPVYLGPMFVVSFLLLPGQLQAPEGSAGAWGWVVRFGRGVAALCTSLPQSAFEWLPRIALAATVLGLVSVAARGKAKVRWSLRAVMAIAAGYVSARGLIHSPTEPWTVLGTVMTLAGFMACVLIAFGTLGPSIPDRQGWEAIAILTLLLAGVSVMLVLVFSNMKQGLAVGILAAALGGMAVAAVWRPRLSLGPGALQVPIMVTSASLFQAYLLGDATRTDRAHLGLAAAAPVLAGLGAAPVVRDIKGWKGLVIRLVIPYLPIGAALEWYALDYAGENGWDWGDVPVLVGVPLAPLAAAMSLAVVKTVVGGGLDPVE